MTLTVNVHFDTFCSGHHDPLHDDRRRRKRHGHVPRRVRQDCKAQDYSATPFVVGHNLMIGSPDKMMADAVRFGISSKFVLSELRAPSIL
jgi:hypothetical protein